MITREDLTVDYCKTWCKNSVYGLAAIKNGSIAAAPTNQSTSMGKLETAHARGYIFWTIYVLESDIPEK